MLEFNTALLIGNPFFVLEDTDVLPKGSCSVDRNKLDASTVQNNKDKSDAIINVRLMLSKSRSL